MSEASSTDVPIIFSHSKFNTLKQHFDFDDFKLILLLFVPTNKNVVYNTYNSILICHLNGIDIHFTLLFTYCYFGVVCVVLSLSVTV